MTSSAACHGPTKFARRLHAWVMPTFYSAPSYMAIRGLGWPAISRHLHVHMCAKKERLAWDKHVCEGSAQGGHLEVLQWARQNECPAARGGHLEVLKGAQQHGCPWDATIFLVMARAGYLGTSDTCDGWTPPPGLIPGLGYSSEKQVLLRVDKLDQVSYHVQVVCQGGMLRCRLKARQALKLCLL